VDKTVLKAAALIDALARSEEPRGITDLARELGWTKSNIHRLLTSLASLGYVRRDAKASRYGLGLKFWEIGTLVVSRLNLKTVAQPYLRKLCEKTGETVHLSMFDNDHVVYIDQVESLHPVRAYSRVGGIGPVHCTATGKTMLAFLPPEVFARLPDRLYRFTPRTIVSKRDLQRALKAIRANGFAMNREEWRLGVSGIAATIFNSQREVMGAVGISGPANRLNDATRRRLAPVVVQTAQRISKDLGYQTPPAA
jgi:IclR family transcriptional regulator, KDG regulon repressor